MLNKAKNQYSDQLPLPLEVAYFIETSICQFIKALF